MSHTKESINHQFVLAESDTEWTTIQITVIQSGSIMDQLATPPTPKEQRIIGMLLVKLVFIY